MSNQPPTYYSKFEGMDRDELFNRNMVTRLGITRHMPIQDALLYILEELNRLDEENRRKDSKINYLETELDMLRRSTQKLGPGYGPNYPNWDPYKSPFTYGPNDITSGVGVVPDTTATTVGKATTNIKATDLNSKTFSEQMQEYFRLIGQHPSEP